MAKEDHLIVPTKNPGQYYIPALGKTFQQVELHDVALEFSDAAVEQNASPNDLMPLLMRRDPGKFLSRLRAGAEMAVTRLMLIGPAQPNELPIEFKVNRKVISQLNPALLRVHSAQWLDSERLNKLNECINIGLTSATAGKTEDLLIGLIALVQRATELPQLGYNFTVPQQLLDDDDLSVENLPAGNAFFVMGILKLPLGR